MFVGFNVVCRLVIVKRLICCKVEDVGKEKVYDVIGVLDARSAALTS